MRCVGGATGPVSCMRRSPTIDIGPATSQSNANGPGKFTRRAAPSQKHSCRDFMAPRHSLSLLIFRESRRRLACRSRSRSREFEAIHRGGGISGFFSVPAIQDTAISVDSFGPTSSVVDGLEAMARDRRAERRQGKSDENPRSRGVPAAAINRRRVAGTGMGRSRNGPGRSGRGRRRWGGQPAAGMRRDRRAGRGRSACRFDRRCDDADGIVPAARMPISFSPDPVSANPAASRAAA